jgi:hypothetical protein
MNSLEVALRVQRVAALRKTAARAALSRARQQTRESEQVAEAAAAEARAHETAVRAQVAMMCGKADRVALDKARRALAQEMAARAHAQLAHQVSLPQVEHAREDEFLARVRAEKAAARFEKWERVAKRERDRRRTRREAVQESELEEIAVCKVLNPRR